MLRFLADENFNRDIVRALMRLSPMLDIVRVQEVNLSGADDPTVLEWAAANGRLLLTHDVSTMTRYAYDRVRAGLKMPGVFEVPRSLSLGRAIEDLHIIAECGVDGEWEGQVRYLPL